jgi:hypothetical protein
MNQFKPQVITGIAGSHCVVLLYGWDVHIDAQIEAPAGIRKAFRLGPKSGSTNCRPNSSPPIKNCTGCQHDSPNLDQS